MACTSGHLLPAAAAASLGRVARGRNASLPVAGFSPAQRQEWFRAFSVSVGIQHSSSSSSMCRFATAFPCDIRLGDTSTYASFVRPAHHGGVVTTPAGLHRVPTGGSLLTHLRTGTTLHLANDPDHPYSRYRHVLTIDKPPLPDSIETPASRAPSLQKTVPQESLIRELDEVEAEIARLRQRRQAIFEQLRGQRWQVSLRPLTPDDEHRQREFLLRMHSADHYTRFFSQKHQYTIREIQKIVNVDYSSDFALAAECKTTDQLLGVAQYFTLADKSEVEMAIVVDKSMKQTGLAAAMLDQLCVICRDHEKVRVYATFLSSNVSAIKLFDKVVGHYGPKIHTSDDDETTDACWNFEEKQE